MKIIVFCNSSFSISGIRLGLQNIASLLAARGHEVDYVAVPTHPLDFLSPVRRPSCVRAWLRGGDKVPVVVAERLREYFLRAPYSRSRKYWWSKRQVRLYTALAPRWMIETRYDACIRDTAMSGLFADRVRARVRILRLNDNPDGLTSHIHPMVVEHLTDQITSHTFAEIWSTTEGLSEKVKALNDAVPVVRIPNGVFLERFDAIRPAPRSPRSAVYLGTFNEWVDLDLLMETAGHLEDWQIDLYGPYKRRLRSLAACRNITYRGSLPFERIPETLSKYRVGLIPFAGSGKILETVDPLKANEYLAAGLGIASTSHGHLGAGLREFARFGNDPASFAAAVTTADQDCVNIREREMVKAHLESVSWNAITDVVEERLRRLSAEG